MQISPKIQLSPSILSADFARLGEQVTEVTAAGADYIHIDIMDGHFVPNISFGPVVVNAVRKHTSLPLDIHLMVESPERHIDNFVPAQPDKADIMTVHLETCPHIHRTVQLIKAKGMKAGVSLNPGTPLSALEEILPFLDLVLIMTVNPGAGGQTFILSMLDKIERLRKELDRKKLTAELEVDGGIKTGNALSVVNAGARVLVAGSAIFHNGETVQSAVNKLRTACERTV
ncbi:MAG: ribulose-phosphate 3-epimerase [Chloroflexota bacterium]